MARKAMASAGEDARKAIMGHFASQGGDANKWRPTDVAKMAQAFTLYEDALEIKHPRGTLERINLRNARRALEAVLR